MISNANSMSKAHNPLAIGFIGLGRVADVHHAALLANSERARLAAVCDTRPEAVRERSKAWGVPGFTRLESMLEKTALDGVVVLLPHHTHEPVMELLLESALPVLLEKPLAVTPEAADRMARLAEHASVPVLVGHNGLFHPSFDRLLELVEAGSIGEPLFATAKSLQWLHFKDWDFRLSREQTGGGVWMDCAGHLLYRLEPLFGEIEAVSGQASTRARPEMEGESTAFATLLYRAGGIAQVAVSYGCKLPGYQLDWPNGCEQAITLHGVRGTLEYEICPTPCIRLFEDVSQLGQQGGGIGHAWRDFPVPEPFEVSFVGQMSHFIDCLEGRAEPRVSPRKAASLVAALSAFYSGS